MKNVLSATALPAALSATLSATLSVAFSATLLSALLLPEPARAQAPTYPDRAVHVVVPFPPGGIVDNVTRKLGAQLTEQLGQQMIIENKAGVGGAIGATYVARAKPDGYTLLSAFDTHAINPLLIKLNYDSDKDLQPIALIATSPLVLVVHPSVPARSLAELVALAKAKPDSLNYASTGAGSSNHLTTELFKSIAGVELNHVPYKGGAPAITDVLGGQVEVMFVSATSVLAHIRSGKMRALAVTSRQPIAALPGVPPVSDTYPDFAASSWVGLLAPAGLPSSVADKLNSTVNTVLKTAEMQKFLADQALDPAGGSAADFGRFMAAETAKWSKVIKDRGIKAE